MQETKIIPESFNYILINTLTNEKSKKIIKLTKHEAETFNLAYKTNNIFLEYKKN